MILVYIGLLLTGLKFTEAIMYRRLILFGPISTARKFCRCWLWTTCPEFDW